MRITGFIWLEEVLEKLAKKHRVHEHEVVEVFESQPKFRFVEKGYREGEDVYAALGRSDAGSNLVVFFVHKSDGRALPVSARDMTKAERKLYERE